MGDESRKFITGDALPRFGGTQALSYRKSWADVSSCQSLGESYL